MSEIVDRCHTIGGSDARIIMGDDEAALLRSKTRIDRSQNLNREDGNQVWAAHPPSSRRGLRGRRIAARFRSHHSRC